MRTLQPIIVAACLLIVSTQPLAAAMRPCCCTDGSSPFATCCPAPSEAEPVTPACPHCAECATVAPTATPIPTALRAADCGCAPAPSLAVVAQDRWERGDSAKLLAFAATLPHHFASAPIALGPSAPRTPFDQFSSGPPLLALHCIWLK